MALVAAALIRSLKKVTYAPHQAVHSHQLDEGSRSASTLMLLPAAAVPACT
jgi:hypothetical protein